MKLLSLYKGTKVVCRTGLQCLDVADSLFTGESYTFFSPDKQLDFVSEKYIIEFSDGVVIECSADTKFMVNGCLERADEIEEGTVVEKVNEPKFGTVKWCGDCYMLKLGKAIGTLLLLGNSEVKGLSGFQCFETTKDVLTYAGFDSSKSELVLNILGSSDISSVVFDESIVFKYGFNERKLLFNAILESGVLSGTKNMLELKSANESLLNGVVLLGRSVGYVCERFKLCVVVYSDSNISVKLVYKCDSECDFISVIHSWYPIILENYVKVY